MPEGDPLSKILITVLLILVNAFFAMSEIAVITFNDVKLRKLADDGDRRAQIMAKPQTMRTAFFALPSGVSIMAAQVSSAVPVREMIQLFIPSPCA